MIKVAVPIGVALMLAGCGKAGHAKRTAAGTNEVRSLIVGDYQGHYLNGVEYFSIGEDGAFSQRFESNSLRYTNQGSWNFHRLDDHYIVSFEPFMELEAVIENRGEPKKFGSWGAAFYEDEPIIWIFRDINYYTVKVPQKL